MGNATDAAGKRGALTGGALTEEALESSRGVLQSARPGTGQRGLQQFFTPSQAADFIKAVIDPAGRSPVLDPTAGSGTLLDPWRQGLRFGIEIDSDWVRKGSYEAITGDLQRAYPMLLKLGVKFPRVVANPPFGLDWTDGAGYPESSTVGTWRMSLGLLEERGVGAFLCGRDRFAREIQSREDAGGVFAVVECDDLFDGVTLPHLIAFYLHPENYNHETSAKPLTIQSCRDELADPSLQEEIRDVLEQSGYVTSDRSFGPTSQWDLVDKEIARRRREKARQAPTYDVEMRGRDRLSVKPSPFVRQALGKANRLKLVEALHNQPVGHFALNALDWRLLGELGEECELTVAPAVAEAVARVTGEAEREVIPLYEVRPQMRLGYLTDLDSIECIKSDPERDFIAGETYPLKTDSKIDVHHGKKVTYNRKGEPVVRKYDEEAEGSPDPNRRRGVLRVREGHRIHPRALLGPEPRRHRDAVPRGGAAPTRNPRRDRRGRKARGHQPRVRVEELPAGGSRARRHQDP